MIQPIIFDKSKVNSKRFQDKNVIITAGTLGIGLAAVHRLANEGAKVFICSRKQENVTEAVNEINKQYGNHCCGGIAINVSKNGELEKFVEQSLKFFNGKIDCVLSNVGMNPQAGSAFDLSSELYDKLMDTNVKSHWKLCKIVKPHLRSPGASIVLVSSTGGYQPEFPLGIYGVSKTALIGLGRALASELGKEGIRVNTLCPGVVRTKMAELLWKGPAGDSLKESTFLNRFADPVDMSGTIAFLLSDDSKHMTGESVVVSGGTQGRL